MNGLWIPDPVLFNPELNHAEKFLLSEIIPLAMNRACTAKNEHFIKRLGMELQTVSNNINSLHAKGYVRVYLDKDAGNQREIYLHIKGNTLYKFLGEAIDKRSIPLYKKFIDVYKERLEGIEKDYIPSINSLDSLYKKFIAIYKDESKEENKVESKEEIQTTAAIAASRPAWMREGEKPTSIENPENPYTSGERAYETGKNEPIEAEPKGTLTPGCAAPLSQNQDTPAPATVKAKPANRPPAQPLSPFPSAFQRLTLEAFPDYYWEAKDASSVAPIVKKIIHKWKARYDGAEPTDENIIDSFRSLLQNLPQWHRERFGLAFVNSQFESIYSQIKANAHGNAGKHANGAPKADLNLAMSIALASIGYQPTK